MKKIISEIRELISNAYNDSDLGHSLYWNLEEKITVMEALIEREEPVRQGEKFVELIDKDRTLLLKVSSIIAIGKYKDYYSVSVGIQVYNMQSKDNQEVLENLIADLKG